MKTIEYPVPLTAYPITRAPFVYTRAGEEQARKVGLEGRIAGSIAMLGGEPLDEATGRMWARLGYVVRREELYAKAGVSGVD